jgi:quercetin dioxygenase-like cupin family protein
VTTIHSLTDLDGSPHANVFPEAEPKTIRLTLDAGEQVDPHRHRGRDIVFYVLDGAIDLHLGSETFAVEAGDIARLEGEHEISPVAIEDSIALVVLAPRTSGT